MDEGRKQSWMDLRIDERCREWSLKSLGKYSKHLQMHNGH